VTTLATLPRPAHLDEPVATTSNDLCDRAAAPVQETLSPHPHSPPPRCRGLRFHDEPVATRTATADGRAAPPVVVLLLKKNGVVSRDSL
jgi:hypothetical protein